MNKVIADYILTNSVNSFNSLEITAVIGCARSCVYCPQDLIIEKYKLVKGRPDHLLHPKTLEKVIQNLPSELLVYWTGFGEPLQNKYFPELFNMICNAGFKSQISTTLFCANPESIDIICDRAKWDRVTLHLPDNSGYMKAQIDDKYLFDLKRVILSMNYDVDMIHVFGSLNDKIKDMFESADLSDVVSRINFVEIDLNSSTTTSRANNLKTDNPVILNENNHDNSLLFCKAKRFNQPVLLPNGDLAMCCMDYGLTNIVGNLIYEPYESIVKRSSIYMSYNLPKLCFNCEWANKFVIEEGAV